MRIGEVARLTGVSRDTVRHYERRGLLKTTPRTEGGYRMYSPDAVEQIRLVRSALAVGFTIAERRRHDRIARLPALPGFIE